MQKLEGEIQTILNPNLTNTPNPPFQGISSPKAYVETPASPTPLVW